MRMALEPHQPPAPALQFGDVTLPSAIEGSVDSEVPSPAAAAAAGASGAASGELTAEQQHAFMKAKAAEKARLLQEQQVR